MVIDDEDAHAHASLTNAAWQGLTGHRRDSSCRVLRTTQGLITRSSRPTSARPDMPQGDIAAPCQLRSSPRANAWSGPQIRTFGDLGWSQRSWHVVGTAETGFPTCLRGSPSV